MACLAKGSVELSKIIVEIYLAVLYDTKSCWYRQEMIVLVLNKCRQTQERVKLTFHKACFAAHFSAIRHLMAILITAPLATLHTDNQEKSM